MTSYRSALRFMVLAVFISLSQMARAQEGGELGDPKEFEERLHHLRTLSEELHRAGQPDIAEELARRAEEMEHVRREQHAREVQDRRADEEARWRREVMSQLAELHEHVGRLSEELAQLRDQQAQRQQREDDRRFSQVDLAGRWLLTLPAGYKYEVAISSKGDNLYQFKVRGNLAGIYRHHGKTVAVEVPADERLTEFVWEFQDENLLLLTKSPPVAKVGSDYRGAILRRWNKSFVEKSAGDTSSAESQDP